MPVFLDSDPGHGPAENTATSLRIGLVNNMGDEALKATERQFVALLSAASENIPVRLSFFTLPGVARTPALARHLQSHYAAMDELWDSQLDGLIVTGREPLAARLDEEPYWPVFVRLVEWARENTHSTIWSCLAAHAAILHMDKIERVKRSNKLFGVFECVHASQHPLLTGLAQTVRLPHSRWNDIAEARLVDCGYDVLTCGAEAGVDTFVKEEKARFIFFQGHPEYSADTLLREYRRDVSRYLRGETPGCPAIPCHYFEASTAPLLADLSNQAANPRRPRLLAEVTAELEKPVIANTWTLSATAIYRNWLQDLCSRKQASSVLRRSHPHDLYPAFNPGSARRSQVDATAD